MKYTHRTSYLFIAAILLFFLVPHRAWPQEEKDARKAGLQVSVAPDPVRFGAFVILTLSYQLPKGNRLPQDPKIEGLEDLTVVEMEVSASHIKIKLLADRIDSWQTGPLSLAYFDQEGGVQKLRADPVSVTVLSALGEKREDAQLRPIQDIVSTKASWFRYLPWAFGLLVFLLAAVGLLWWHKRGRFDTLSGEIVDPPHVRAKKEIMELERQRLFEKGEIKAFYFRLSEIMRQYLEALRGFPAAEFTTEEIALRMRTEQDRSLLPLLRHADLVKFADTVPSPARKEEELKAALEYIHETSAIFDGRLLQDQSSGVSA
jgi:hypothetical protein